MDKNDILQQLMERHNPAAYKDFEISGKPIPEKRMGLVYFVFARISSILYTRSRL